MRPHVNVIALSRSPSFESHLLRALEGAGLPAVSAARDPEALDRHEDAAVVLVHARSFRDEDLEAVVARAANARRRAVGVAADVPRLEQMLELSRHGIRAYFNSYMADVHYRQMLAMLGAGQCWFAPQLLGHALEAARRQLDGAADEAALEGLTRRQQEIARDVSSGLSNRQIAGARGISERTVKTHLTHIFRKLGVTSRHALGARLRRAVPGDPAGKAS